MKSIYMRLLSLLLVLFIFAPAAHAVRTNITPVSPKSPNAGTISANGADVVATAADTSNQNAVAITGRELVLVENTSADTAYTCTFTSVADRNGRLGHITSYSLSAGEKALFGNFTLEGWKQTDGKLYLEANNAAIKFLIIKIPAAL